MHRRCRVILTRSGPPSTPYETGLEQFDKGRIGFKALCGLQGAPDKLTCFADATRRSRGVLKDHDVAGVISGEPVGTGIRVLKTSLAAFHIVKEESHIALMESCWDEDSDAARLLLIDTALRLMDVLKGERLPDKPLSLALRATHKLSETILPSAKIRKILSSVNQDLVTCPHTAASIYIALQAMGCEREAWKSYEKCLRNKMVTGAAFNVYISYCRDFSTAQKIHHAYLDAGYPFTSKVANSLLLTMTRQRDTRDNSSKILMGNIQETLKMMNTYELSIDPDTLGIIAAICSKNGMGVEARQLTNDLRCKFPSVMPTRNCLTALIASQIDLCAESPEALDAAEGYLLEILERDLLKEPPYNTTQACFARLMQCYAKVGDVTRSERLRDSFSVHLTHSSFRENFPRIRTMQKSTYSETFRTAFHKAKTDPNLSWGGVVNDPSTPADSDASLATNPPDIEGWL
eukprot:TRINITY_DN37607_c0_g1_i1.p1 TRINITY_DN37607_c0_g1~~TRINITY_DN37607_c0_g1_i1.p1  ORF type:complete len:462 (+),score=43.23 TRINITY_DN37607_c0_g1_i1:29-1414(+)